MSDDEARQKNQSIAHGDGSPSIIVSCRTLRLLLRALLPQPPVVVERVVRQPGRHLQRRVVPGQPEVLGVRLDLGERCHVRRPVRQGDRAGVRRHRRRRRVHARDPVGVRPAVPRGKIQVQENRRCLGGDLIDTASMIRTAPLWGLRVRPQLLHDGSALTIDEAIRKHRGQAEKVRLNYEHVLTQEERNQLLAFLSSL